MNADRTINFGKYKGTPIKQLILEHIGYIYWCLFNLKWFKLKYKINLGFPVQELSKHIKDKDRYLKRETPFIISKDGIISYYLKDKDNPIISSVLKYKSDIMPLAPLTTAQMGCIAKYLFEPMEDEFYDDYFIGENPHSYVE